VPHGRWRWNFGPGCEEDGLASGEESLGCSPRSRSVPDAGGRTSRLADATARSRPPVAPWSSTPPAAFPPDTGQAGTGLRPRIVHDRRGPQCPLAEIRVVNLSPAHCDRIFGVPHAPQVRNASSITSFLVKFPRPEGFTARKRAYPSGRGKSFIIMPRAKGRPGPGGRRVRAGTGG
jgi:hypothetical protein